MSILNSEQLEPKYQSNHIIYLLHIRVQMIGKFSKVKQINHLYCVSLLPHINEKSLTQQNADRTTNKTQDKSPKKEKTLTLQKIKQKLKKEIEDIEPASIGNIQKSLLTNKNPSKISNKIIDTSYISYNSRIHAIIYSPVYSHQKGRSFFKRQNLYPHKARALTEQAKKQSNIKEKQLPMFSIKQLKTLLKNIQKLVQNDSGSFQIQSSPISKLCDSSQIKPKSNFKSLEQLEMNVTQIQITNSKQPRKNPQQVSKNLPCFIVKRSLQHSKQYSKKRTFNFNTINKTNNKYILSQRSHQQSECPQLEMKKKYSEQIENELMELSTPRNYSLLRKSTRTEPSLSAWQ